MKHINIFYIIFCMAFIFGCTNKPKRIIEQPLFDSIAKIEKEIQDSIEKIRTDSLARIAWGDALFGMSIEEALNTHAFKGSDISNTEEGQMLSLPTEKLKIGNTHVQIMSFRAFFEMNELCYIFIRSYPQPANRINDLESDALAIAKKFKKKYGKPNESLDKKVSILDFQENEPIRLRIWNLGDHDKTIYITLKEEESGYEYYYEISILGWKYPIKKDIETVQKEAQKERENLEKYQF